MRKTFKKGDRVQWRTPAQERKAKLHPAYYPMNTGEVQFDSGPSNPLVAIRCTDGTNVVTYKRWVNYLDPKDEKDSDFVIAYAREACGDFWDDYNYKTQEAAALVARRALRDLQVIR